VDFTWTPTSVIAGQQMQFKVSVATGNPTKWYWDFGDGSDSTQREPFHTFAVAGDYVVTFQAENCKGLGTLRSRTVAVAGNCTESAAPVAAINTNIPEPKVGQKVRFTDASTGTVSSREWTIKNGAGQTVHSEIGSAPSEVRFTEYQFMQTGTFTVSLKATNCKGSNTKVLEVQVRSRCDQTQSPVADFTWGPTGPADGFPSQQRPYEGQEVQLTDASTNAPDGWHWYDFQEVPAADYTVRNPKHTWQQPGEKTVRLIATNCFGSGSETSKKVTIYEDNRPVTADFTWIVQTLEEADATVATDVPVKFTAATGYAKGDPNEFSFRFGDDNSTPSGATVNHTFLCRGKVQVAMIARRKLPSGRVVTGNVTKTIEVTGNVCGPESLVAPDAAQVPGLNGTSWRTDLRIFNPGTQPTQVWLAVLPAGQNNAQPFQVGPYMVPAKGTQALNNILQMFELLLNKNYTKAAVRITYESPEDEHPIVIGRTYTDVDGGGTYGQYVPGIPVIANSTTSPLWITGLRHDGIEHGFRTNLGFANLRGDAGGVSGMHVSLLDGTGALRASKTLNLAPYGYLQDTLKNLFGEAAETVGVFSLKIELPPDTDVQPYASVVDNLTGDNILISAVPPVENVVFLPAVAHNKGEAGTVWRTSVQLTNTDDEAHSTEIKFFPKGGAVPGTFRSISLAPGQSARTEDLIEWIYSPLIAPDASGVVRIAPGDASGVMPAVAARTYNLTANGTFGQDVPPLQGSMGIVKGGENERMFITGMSSADVARTNLGFVCLSDTQGVDFAVYFYDGDGNLLNPEGKPYTFALGANGWDQDKLENRFKNFFKQDLPANLEVISAEIVVRTGGPGFAYASVIDNITGDPIFVPGHSSP
jgi:PKD repeat protein